MKRQLLKPRKPRQRPRQKSSPQFGFNFGEPPAESPTNSRRHVKPERIIQPSDFAAKMDKLVLQVMRQLSEDGRVEASLTTLALHLAELLPDDPMREKQWIFWLRKTVKMCIWRLKQRRFIARVHPPTHVDCEVFRLCTDDEIWSWLNANGYTHFRRKGRGIELLRLTTVEAASGK